TYASTSPGTLPTGMTIPSTTGVIGISALTPAGTYTVTVGSTDSTAGTPLTGSITFDIVVGLHLTRTSTVSGTNGVASNITTISAAGATGSVTYSLDAATLALPGGWVTINSSTGVVSITTSAPIAAATTVTVTATDGTAAPGASSAGTGTITFTFAVN
ncbi:MAG: putative Ig domain, partial [Bryobacterales bacterium]|nr:putative Ig domain [Bryobacterales bacterium]